MSGPFLVQIPDYDAEQSAANLTKSLNSPAYTNYRFYNPLGTPATSIPCVSSRLTTVAGSAITSPHGRTDRKVRPNSSAHFCSFHSLRIPAQRHTASDKLKYFIG